MKRFLVTTLMYLSAAAATAAPATKPVFDPALGLSGKANTDVVGIKLGMSEAQVLKILKARTPALQIDTVAYRDPALKQIIASEGCKNRHECNGLLDNSYGDKAAEAIVVELLDGKVWFARRRLSYDVSDAATPSPLAAWDAGVAKYGPLVSYTANAPKPISRSNIDSDGVVFLNKTFNSEGRLLSRHSNCQSSTSTSHSQSLPDFFSEEASWNFSFEMRRRPLPEGVTLVSELGVVLIDCESMRTHIKAEDAKDAAAQQARAAARAKQAGAAKPSF